MNAAVAASKLVTIGICAFNEEGNIGQLLGSILDQRLSVPSEIVVVSDGSTDQTDSIVEDIAKGKSDIRLIRHATRKGKSEALNTLFSASKGDIVITIAGDTRLDNGSLQRAVDAFDDGTVGMSWAKLVPLNEDRQLVNRLGHLTFRLHDRLSRKLSSRGEVRHATGDIVSIRREAVTEIPAHCVNDDEYLAMQAVRRGFRVLYIPDALYRAPMPRTMLDYVRQRRRWVYGHVQAGRMLGEYSTVLEFIGARRPLLVASVVVEEIAERPSELHVFLGSLLVELVVGFLVFRDLLLRVSHSPWKVVQSTKSTISRLPVRTQVVNSILLKDRICNVSKIGNLGVFSKGNGRC